MEKQKDIISAKHPEYEEARCQREIFSDVCEGTAKMREKGKKYLEPFPAENDSDYEYRRKVATLFNFTKKTVDVMTGLVFKSEIELQSDVNSQIKTLWENIDNKGTHGDVFCRELFEDSFEGFAVILVDAPNMQVADLESEINLGLRPYWISYDADCVINGDYRINPISKKKELQFIVFREETRERINSRFVFEEVIRYRHFFLADSFDQLTNSLQTTVNWELWREVKNDKGEIEYVLEQSGILPRLSQIPVAIVGELYEEPLLMDIAYKNIEHYQTYSDYKNTIHKTCVPMLTIAGEDAKTASTKVVGASVALASENTDFKVGFAEVKGEGIPNTRQSLIDNREEMALIEIAEISSLNGDDRSSVNNSIRDMPFLDQLPQPGCGILVVLVVVSTHAAGASPRNLAISALSSARRMNGPILWA